MDHSNARGYGKSDNAAVFSFADSQAFFHFLYFFGDRFWTFPSTSEANSSTSLGMTEARTHSPGKQAASTYEH
jgi:hypothetical protein